MLSSGTHYCRRKSAALQVSVWSLFHNIISDYSDLFFVNSLTITATIIIHYYSLMIHFHRFFYIEIMNALSLLHHHPYARFLHFVWLCSLNVKMPSYPIVSSNLYKSFVTVLILHIYFSINLHWFNASSPFFCQNLFVFTHSVFLKIKVLFNL